MKYGWIMLSAVLLAGAARAQHADLEPGVQTSSSAAPTASAPKAANSKPAEPKTVDAKAAEPKPAEAKPEAAKTTPDKPPLQHAANGDRLELETTEISGNRELPRVMYVVPWRKDDLAQYAGRPPNSLLDEALTPVDRDVFRRQVQYYDALKGGATSPNSQPQSPGAPSAPQTTQDVK